MSKPNHCQIPMPSTTTNRKRKRISWPEGDPVLKTGEALKDTERVSTPKTYDCFTWRDYMKDEEIEPTTEGNTIENERNSITSTALATTLESFKIGGGLVSKAKRHQLQLENYQKYNDPTGFLTCHFVNSSTSAPTLKAVLKKYPTTVTSDCLDYLNFKIQVIEENGNAMICWATGVSAKRTHLRLLRNCATILKEHIIRQYQLEQEENYMLC